ncbi:unnamed protein product [Nezara viridula]|uniref:cholesterol 7-desaturase n=1 Tax=Nezara viridula TaxID=85310 RepID=A0A9P0EG72_NEZVI|nr:unnamed protein product [Nezara viridula]
MLGLSACWPAWIIHAQLKNMEGFLLNSGLYDIIMFITDHLTFKKIFLCIIGWLIYKLFIKPMNYVKGLCDVGWLEGHRNLKTRVIGKIPPVYPNGWFAIAESDSLKKGQILHVAALGENFAVFRSSNGVSRILDAYCPHLGANMAVGGKVVGDCIQCPFHLWKFNGATGLCTSIPYTDKIPKTAKVRSWNTVETNGFIFVWYHAEGEEPNWFPEEIKEINHNKLTYFGRNQFQIKCHIQDVPENGSDMTHFAAIHEAAAMNGGDLRYQEKTMLKFFRHKWQAVWEPCNENGKQHTATSIIDHHIDLFGKIKIAKCRISAYQTGPGYVVLKVNAGFGTVLLLQVITPVEPLVQKVIHRVYSPAYLMPFTRFFFLSEAYMFERDIMIWNNKVFFDQPIYTREDKSIARFRRWYQQFYTQHSKTYAMAKEGLDW